MRKSQEIIMDKYENKSAVYWFKDENGKVVYVGSTNNLYKRMYNHNWCIKNSDRPNSKLYQFLRTNNYIVDYYYTEDYKLREREMIEEYKPIFNKVRVVSTSKLNISVKAADNYAEYHRQYLQANREYNEEHKEYCRKWAKEHRDYFRNYYRTHKQSKDN